MAAVSMRLIPEAIREALGNRADQGGKAKASKEVLKCAMIFNAALFFIPIVLWDELEKFNWNFLD
jgi:hypothetical protein